MGKIHKKVLVLGEDTRSFLTVVRSLGRAGIEVHVGWCRRKSPATYSKYIRLIHNIPNPSSSSEDWKGCLKNVLVKENYDLIIPCHDEDIIPLQLNKEYFKEVANIYLLDDYAYKIASSKHASYKLAKQLGIPVPRQMYISPSVGIEQIISKIKFPLVLKPLTSFTEDDLIHRKDVEKIFTLESLEDVLPLMLSDGDLLIQENFDGVGAGVECLAKDGEILVAFQHFRVHEPLLGGGSSYRKSVLLAPELMDATSKLIKALNYTGVGMVEYKLNTETERWVFLEINGRFWGSLPLPVSAGINFPLYLYELLVNGKTKFQTDYPVGIHCRNLTLDIEWMRANLEADKFDPHIRPYQFWSIVIEFVKNIFTLRERSDTFVVDDLKPGLFDILIWSSLKWKGIKKKIKSKLQHPMCFCKTSGDDK